MKPFVLASSVIAAVIAAVSFLPHTGTVEVAEKTAMLMGTVVDIKIPFAGAANRPEAAAAIDRALDEVRRVEKLFSAFLPDSEVSAINATKKGEALKISGETFSLIERALAFSAVTDGAFDITVKPLVDLWAGARSSGGVPADNEIIEARDRVGFRDLILDRRAGTIAFGRDGMSIDMAAIAKGYAVDRAVKVMRDAGVKNAIVDCGGDMYCLGERSPGRQWKVGIRHPRDRGKIFMEFPLKDAAVDTSGDYEKFFTASGKRYSHIVDPRTGYPVGDNVVSATVVAGDSVTSDALATALCVLGPKGLESLGRLKYVDAVLVVSDNGKLSLRMSEGFNERRHAVETSDIR
jgi:thiamine biosynthesis lipoprotein